MNNQIDSFYAQVSDIFGDPNNTVKISENMHIKESTVLRFSIEFKPIIQAMTI